MANHLSNFPSRHSDQVCSLPLSSSLYSTGEKLGFSFKKTYSPRENPIGSCNDLGNAFSNMSHASNPLILHSECEADRENLNIPDRHTSLSSSIDGIELAPYTYSMVADTEHFESDSNDTVQSLSVENHHRRKGSFSIVPPILGPKPFYPLSDPRSSIWKDLRGAKFAVVIHSSSQRQDIFKMY